MEILKNSVWKISECEGIDAGLYRLLHLYSELNCLVLFPLNTDNSCVRPFTASIAAFKAGVKSKNIVLSEFCQPAYMSLHDSEISPKYTKKRDKHYQLIKSLVKDLNFLVNYASTKRSPTLAQYANDHGTHRRKIARLLSLYWKYGQDKNALLPAYINSGGLGKDKDSINGQLGAPKTPRTVAVERSKTFKLKDQDKKHIHQTIKKFHLKENGLSLKKTHGELLKIYYKDEVRNAAAENRPPYVPSYRQLQYWRQKLFSPEELVRKTTSEQDYMLNRRGLLGTTKVKWFVPGSSFEIDATVADVHIVSSFGQQHVLGRPTIYSIVDRASGVIVGFNVSLFYASWRAARQALANAFLPKTQYCKEFGIDIDESDWPCAQLPMTLMADNGEMIGLNPQKLVVPLTELQLSPAYRPDFKAMVERKFGLLNTEVIHELMGTTRGGYVIRGEQDPRANAIYTLREFTALLIDAVLDLNSNRYDSLATQSPLLIQHDLIPTPLNYWNVHLEEHLHALKHASVDDIISRLYPSATVSMTRDGIAYNRMYYSNDYVIQNNLASVARSQGQWQMDARINENTTNYIYVRFDKNSGFNKCNLLPKSRMFKNQPMQESEFVMDWIDGKRELSPINVRTFESSKRRKKISKTARKRKKESDLTYAQSTSNMRKHRQEEIDATTNRVEKESVDTNEINQVESKPRSNVVSYLPRRKRKNGDN